MPYGLVIVPAEHVVSARAIAESAFDLPAEVAAKEFVPAGSPTGAEPATHYWIATKFGDSQWVELQQLASTIGWGHVEAYDLDTEPLKPWDILAAMGLQPLKHEP